MRWGTFASGVLIAAARTGKVLLLRRSDEVTEPRTWAIPGGKVEPGENPQHAAFREAQEEAGLFGSMLVTGPVYTFKEPNFEFQTFLGIVEDEFEPVLNWESDDWGWFSLSRMPRPLHPGVREMLDWRGPQIAAEIQRFRATVA